MLRKASIYTLCLVLFSLSLFVIPNNSAHAAGWDFSWTVDSTLYNETTQLGYNDGPAVYYWDATTGKYWHIDNQQGNRVIRSGTTFANMASTGYSATINGVTGNGAQAWPQHIFRRASDGIWYMIVHVEYDYGVHPGHDHLMKMGYASTTDPNLANWTYQGDLLTVDSGLSSDGAGDAGFFQYGSNYYMFYHQKFDSYSGLMVARATTANFGATGWTKWYNGSYSQPGNGGLQSPIIGNNTNTLYAQPTISWNTYLNRFIIIYNDVSTWVGTGNLTNVNWGISYSTDTTNLASWQPNQMFYHYGSEGWNTYKELFGVGTSGGKDSDWITAQSNSIFFSPIPSYATSGKNVTFTLGAPSNLIQNPGFENGMTNWASDGSSAQYQYGVGNLSVGQDGNWYGYIQNFNAGYTDLYQVVNLPASHAYTYSAKVQSSGANIRMLVYNQGTGQVVASKTFNNTSWATQTLSFTSTTAANYTIAIDSSGLSGANDWARLDTVTLN
jgi:hypothetical protein